MSPPTFPPLLRGRAARDPFAAAREAAAAGCDPGLVTHDARDDLRAALVLAPEVSLEDAAAMLPACGLGLASALGALGPSEMAVEFTWEGGILVNGAACGGLRGWTATADPEAVPDWLVIGVEMRWRLAHEPGLTPERTTLAEEGCAELRPARLLEAWARHGLSWIHRWGEEGAAPLHAAWRGLLPALGGRVAVGHDGTTLEGTFVGLDERFGMLLRTGSATRLIPLSSRLEVAGAPRVAVSAERARP